MGRAPATAEHGGRFAIFANQEGHDLRVGEECSEIQQLPTDRVSLETLDLHCHHLAVLLVMVTWRTQMLECHFRHHEFVRQIRASGEEVPEPVPEVAVEVPGLTGLQFRAAWQAMVAVDMSLMFQHRPEVMRSVPHFLFMLLPRLLLHKPLRGGNVPRHKLITRFEHFAQGQWGSDSGQHG